MADSATNIASVNPGTHRGFLSGVLMLASGSTLAQVITLAAMPLITRLYAPEAFGAFSVFVALTTLLISISSLQFAEVIVIAKSSREADQALFLGAVFAVFLSLLAALGLWWFAQPLSDFFRIPGYDYVFHLAAVVVLLGGLRQVMRRWLLREHHAGRIAVSEVGMAVADRLSTLGLAMPLGGSPLGLVLGRILGFVAGLVLLVKPSSCRAFSREPGQYSIAALGKILRRYLNFVVHSWGVLLDNVAQQLPVLLVSAWMGPVAAGGFALAKRVLAEPAIVLGAALAQSYYQYAARATDEAAVTQLTQRMTLVLLKCIAIPAIILLGCAPEVFPLVFGKAWQETGWYTLILSPMFMVYFVMRPLNKIFDLAERQREKGTFAAQNILVIVLALSLAIGLRNDLVIFFIFSLASTLFLSYRAVWLLSLVGVSARSLATLLAPAFTVAALLSMAQLLLRHYLQPGTAMMIGFSVAVCGLYTLLFIVRDRNITGLLAALRRKI